MKRFVGYIADKIVKSMTRKKKVSPERREDRREKGRQKREGKTTERRGRRESKGEDKRDKLREKRMGGGMMGRRFGYKGGKLVGKQKNIDVAAPFGTINEKDFDKLRERKK